MITLDEAEIRIATWINTVTGRQPVLARRGQHGVPAVPYVTLFRQSVRRISLPDVEGLADGEQETITALYALDYVFDLYRGDVSAAYTRLSLSLSANNRQFDVFDGNLLGVGLIGVQRDLSSVVASNFKPRLNFELTFNIQLEDTFVSNVIEKFDLITKVEEFDYEKTIELPNQNPA